MQTVSSKTVLTGVRSGGSVQQYLEGFAAELISAGYAELPIRDYVRSAAHLGRWMDSRNIGIDRLGEVAFTEFAQHKCECHFAGRRGRHPSRRYVARARRFADYLGRLGIVPSLPSPIPSVVPEPLVGFHNWMTQHRGVKPPTVKRYERLIKELLPALGGNPAVYDAARVRQVLVRKVKELSRGYAKTYVTAIRAFLRFLAANGRCRPHLDRAIPTVPEWKLSALPRYLDSDDVERLIASCDLSKSFGVRDRAILLLLARLGLRVSELVGLLLDDLQTHPQASIRVRGKGRRERVLPLWKETAKVLREWTAVRAQMVTSELFLNAQGDPMSRAGFEYILAKHVKTAATVCPSIASKRVSPHVLRHTCAMHTLQATHDVRKVSLWLGHASMKSTEVYLRADPTEKLEAMNAGVAPSLRRGRFQAPDRLLAMLRSS